MIGNLATCIMITQVVIAHAILNFAISMEHLGWQQEESEIFQAPLQLVLDMGKELFYSRPS